MQDREAADPQSRYEGNAEQVAVALGALPQNARLALVLHASGYREVEIARRRWQDIAYRAQLARERAGAVG